MDNGKIVECGKKKNITPIKKILIQKKNRNKGEPLELSKRKSFFSELIEETGKESKQSLLRRIEKNEYLKKEYSKKEEGSFDFWKDFIENQYQF